MTNNWAGRIEIQTTTTTRGHPYDHRADSVWPGIPVCRDRWTSSNGSLQCTSSTCSIASQSRDRRILDWVVAVPFTLYRWLSYGRVVWLESKDFRRRRLLSLPEHSPLKVCLWICSSIGEHATVGRNWGYEPRKGDKGNDLHSGKVCDNSNGDDMLILIPRDRAKQTISQEGSKTLYRRSRSTNLIWKPPHTFVNQMAMHWPR